MLRHCFATHLLERGVDSDKALSVSDECPLAYCAIVHSASAAGAACRTAACVDGAPNAKLPVGLGHLPPERINKINPFVGAGPLEPGGRP
jgi:hypothetical protein